MDIDYSEYKRMVKALLDDVRKSLKYHIDRASCKTPSNESALWED